MKGIYFFIFLLIAISTLLFGDLPLNFVLGEATERLAGHSERWNALIDERLPRLLILLFCGASLATAGAVMQSLFQSPLASPSVLGVSAGGSLFAIAVIAFKWHLIFPAIWPLAAVLGCLFTLLMVYWLALHRGELQVPLLILSGVAISTLLLTFQSVLIYLLRDQWQLVMSIKEWEMGSTLNRSWKQFHLMAPLTLVGLYGCWFYRQELDLMSLGDEEAENMGVDVRKVRWRLFLCIALLTGGVIASLGVIAFFGLVLPNLLRLIHGARNSVLIRECILLGSISLAGMDLALRVADVQWMTIGNVSAILGGIFFVGLLFKNRYRFA